MGVWPCGLWSLRVRAGILLLIELFVRAGWGIALIFLIYFLSLDLGSWIFRYLGTPALFLSGRAKLYDTCYYA